MTEQTINITKEEYDNLIQDSLILRALEDSGVDNWEGYEEAMKLMKEWEEEE